VPAYSTVVAEAKNADVAVTAVDHKAQEDAWRYDWVADGASSVALVAPDALDLSRETNGDVLLLMTLRIETPTPKETALFVECGDDCAGRVPAGAQLAALPVGQWISVGMPLKCFAAAGANMGRLTAAAGIESTAGYRLAISEVGYGTVSDHLLTCNGP
jgi:beta-glucosidase